MLLLWIQETFGMNPRDADRRDMKIAPGARMTIPSGLRLYKRAYH